MAFRTFRVRKPFNWNGVELRPGDVWLVDDADARWNRVEILLEQRFASGDATLPSGEKAASDRELQRQLPKKPVGVRG